MSKLSEVRRKITKSSEKCAHREQTHKPSKYIKKLEQDKRKNR